MTLLASAQQLSCLSGRIFANPRWRLGLILLLATALRVERIRQPYLDAFSWRQSDAAMIADNYYRYDHNILYVEVSWNGPGKTYQGREFQTVTYISASLYPLLGQHDWVGRSVAVAFGLWGIIALYQVVRLAWRDDYALLAALLMAIMPGAIFMERSFLPDPAMVALMVTSLWLWLHYLRTGRSRYLILAGLFGAWGACTKITGLIIGLPMAYAWFALTDPQHRWRRQSLMPGALFAALILVPTAAYYLWARHLALSNPPFHFAGAGRWLWDSTIEKWVSEQYYLPELLRHTRDWLWRWPVISLVTLGLLFRPPTQPSEMTSHEAPCPQRAPWLFHWWLIAGVIYYFIGARELVENPWNLHLMNPAAAAICAYAIGRITVAVSRSRRSGALLAWVIALAMLLAIWLVGRVGLNWMRHPYAYDDYSMGLALGDVTTSDELVVTITSDLGDPVAIFYSRRRGWPFPPLRPFLGWNRLPATDRRAIDLFEDLRAQGAGWLGIVAPRREALQQQYPDFMAHLRQSTALWSENEQYTIYRIEPPHHIPLSYPSKQKEP
ncbi:MAG: ArnT family glycosyltransferase [Chloroflexota bacterium]